MRDTPNIGQYVALCSDRTMGIIYIYIYIYTSDMVIGAGIVYCTRNRS